MCTGIDKIDAKPGIIVIYNGMPQIIDIFNHFG